MRTPPAQPLLAYSPAASNSQSLSISSTDLNLPLIEGIPPSIESGGEDAGQALDPDLPFYQSDEDQDVNDPDDISEDGLSETQATTPQMVPSEIDSKLSEASMTKRKPAHRHRHRKRAGRKLSGYERMLRILRILLIFAVILVLSYYLGKYLFPMEEPSREPGERGAWCYWKLQSDGLWRYCDWCNEGFEFKNGVCVSS